MRKKFIYFFVVLFLCSWSMESIAQRKNINPNTPGILEATNYVPPVVMTTTDNPENTVVTVISGASTSSAGSGPQGNYRYHRVSYIITPTEMSASGFPLSDIISIGFNIGTAQNIPVQGSLKVYLQNTSDVTFTKGTSWATIITGMTLASDGTVTLPATTGTYDLLFAGGSPFTYTGGGLYIAYEWQNPVDPLSTAPIHLCNSSLASSLVRANSAVSLPETLGFSAFRPTTRLGSNLVDVLDIVRLYTLGKTPSPFGNPTPISALISNVSGSTVSFPVGLTVFRGSDGLIRHTDVVIVTELAGGTSQLVTFEGFNALNVETDSVRVEVPPQTGETFLSNNQKKNILIVNNNSYSYQQSPVPDGGVGFNGGTGDFVARFMTNSPNSINQVDVNFNAGGQPYNIGIWDATGPGGSPGTNLWTSPGLTSAAGVATILVDPPVVVDGNFYVGVRQTGTVNVSFSFQNESPIRPGTFYFASPTGSTTWNDFAPANPFRFMIEPKFALNNDVASTNIGQSGTQYYPEGTTSIAMTGTVANLGLNSASFDVMRRIYDGSNNIVYTNTQSVTNLASNGTQVVNFSAFTTFIAGTTYRIQDSTMLATDQNRANDTSSVFFTPNIARKTAVIWGDATCRDTFVANFENYFGSLEGLSDLDIISMASFAGSMSAWNSVVVLFADFQNWSPGLRNSMKDYLDNSTMMDKKSLLVFGNDLGWHNDPIRNPSATPEDTTFYRQYLRGQYIADNWLTSIATAGNKFKGMNAFSSVTLDSLNGPFPDCFRPVNGGTTAFAPNNPGQAGDTATAVYFSNDNYNMFYAGNRYQDFRRMTTVVDASPQIYESIFDWVIDNDGILPVDLVSFNATVDRNNVTLNWSTAWEENNMRFDVQRKIANSEGQWLTIGSVAGNGTTYEQKNYNYVDKNLVSGKYDYRLVQIDFDGNSTADFNLTQSVEVGIPSTFALAQNYPNPFNPNTKIAFEIPVESFVKLAIYDMSGREVSVLVNNVVTPGYFVAEFNGSSLASGVYFYRLVTSNNVITKKMTLIK